MANKKEYHFPLRLDANLEKPLKILAEKTRPSINDYINVAVKLHLRKLKNIHKIEIE